jgi:hypothetical protein
MRKRTLSFIAIAIALFIAAWNLPLTYYIGVDGVVMEKKIPSYAKICGFLYRDWMYKDIVHDIVRGDKEDDMAKVLAILHWVNTNIISTIPDGIKVVDDHPLNIIIRRYGTKEQLEDIFTILCSYAGFKSGMGKCYSADKKSRIVLSFVRVGSRWAIFSAAENKYFLNNAGQIGSVEDYLCGKIIIPDGSKDAYYKEYLDDVRDVDFAMFTRPEEQKPIGRCVAMAKKYFKQTDKGW